MRVNLTLNLKIIPNLSNNFFIQSGNKVPLKYILPFENFQINCKYKKKSYFPSPHHIRGEKTCESKRISSELSGEPESSCIIHQTWQ